MLETRVQMWLKSKLNNYGIVMTVDVSVYSVKSLENLTDQDWKGLWKGHAWHSASALLVV